MRFIVYWNQIETVIWDLERKCRVEKPIYRYLKEIEKK